MKKTNKQKYEAYDEADWEKAYFDEQTQGFVVIHNLHGKGERSGNFQIAQRLAILGFMVELLPVSPQTSVDSCIDEEFWEFKTTSGSVSSVQTRLREGKEQSDKILLSFPKERPLGDILRGIISSINMDKSRKIQTVGLLFDKELVRWTRSEILKRDFKKLKPYLDIKE
ncbi:MAG: hypothetical protein JNL70_07420 [Saprospiraceae bacterium]|nr:hypothetical protein [Saprospiraceae bacterium]